MAHTAAAVLARARRILNSRSGEVCVGRAEPDAESAAPCRFPGPEWLPEGADVLSYRVERADFPSFEAYKAAQAELREIRLARGARRFGMARA